ncbi:lysine--tRNA ligase, partial [Salmonella enterica subsp. enterica serovar Oranienburg]|nr:lysine--tRNA ligase [Salmonella enterica subsp. enterica serovar Oranienburg]
YQAYATYTEIMDLTEEVIREAAKNVIGTTRLVWEGNEIDVGPAFRRWSMEDAVLELNPEIKREELRDREAMAAHAKRLGCQV